MNIFIELLKSFHPDQDGFVFMWILAFMAFLSVAIILERWFDIMRRTDVDAENFTDHIKKMILEKKFSEAYKLCSTAGGRALPRIIGAGLKRAEEPREIIISAMEEESLHMVPTLEKRVNYILMMGNISTLIGLMGTIFGLILSFQAVAQPDVDPIQKSSMLASGISAAMNTTLLGLLISVPCVMIFALLRTKIDRAIQEIDRYAASVLKVLLPNEPIRKDYKVTSKRMHEEIDTEPNVAPMMNLMVILIPMLLTSAEFVKIGAIELKLPEIGSGGGVSTQNNSAKLSLGIVITKKGFNLFHYFKNTDDKKTAEIVSSDNIEIPKKGEKYDYKELNRILSEVKKNALLGIVASVNAKVPKDATLEQLFNYYSKNDLSAVAIFKDHADIKIVAEEKIKYQTIVNVMDAARATQAKHGKIPLFPNVSLAGGIL